MKKSMLLFILLFAIILVLIFTLGKRLVQGENPPKVYALTGSAELQPKAQSVWRNLTYGEVINIGDTIRTGENSNIDLAWPVLIHIWIEPNTTIKVTQAERNATKGINTTTVALPLGKVWVKIRKETGQTITFTVSTPAGAVETSNGLFSIGVKADGQTQIECDEGSLKIVKSKEVLNLRKDTSCILSKDAVIRKPTTFTPDQIKTWQSKQEIVGAFLSVEQPKDGETISNPLLTVSGYTDPGNLVEINGEKVSVNSNGKWTFTHTVTKGENTLTIHALDGDGNQRTLTRKVIY